jgi:hypothetical protein
VLSWCFPSFQSLHTRVMLVMLCSVSDPFVGHLLLYGSAAKYTIVTGIQIARIIPLYYILIVINNIPVCVILFHIPQHPSGPMPTQKAHRAPTFWLPTHCTPPRWTSPYSLAEALQTSFPPGTEDGECAQAPLLSCACRPASSWLNTLPFSRALKLKSGKFYNSL